MGEGGTRLQVSTPVDRFSCMIAQTTQTLAGCVSLGAYSVGQIPPPKKKGALIDVFQPNNTPKYWKFHFKSATKFCTVIKRPSSTLRGWSKYSPNKSKMADGRHLEKSKNRDISGVQTICRKTIHRRTLHQVLITGREQFHLTSWGDYSLVVGTYVRRRR